MNIGDLDFGYGGDNLYDPGVFSTNLLGQGSKTDYSWFDPDISIGDSYAFTPSKKSGVDWGGVLTKGAETFLSGFSNQPRSNSGGGGVQTVSYVPTAGSRDIYSSGGDRTEIGSGIYEEGGVKDAVILNKPEGGNRLVYNSMTQPRMTGSALGAQPSFVQSLANTVGSTGTKMLQNMALRAIPGVGPAIAFAANIHPEGLKGLVDDGIGVVQNVGSFAGDVVGNVVRGVGDFFGGLFGCDERLKVDIAPLETTEINDELAQMAFFVKGLRECS
jgi:hypothetical protein